MHEINPYNILGVPEKYLEIGLHLAAPLQYAIKPTDNKGGESLVTCEICRFLPLGRRSVLTLAQRFSHHITPDYPGEKSSVTFPQFTHTWSESNFHKVAPTPPPNTNPGGTWPWPQLRNLRVKLGVLEGLTAARAAEKMWPLPWIHNSCSSGSPCRVPVQHFLHTYLLFIILISAETSLCCSMRMIIKNNCRKKHNGNHLNDWFC